MKARVKQFLYRMIQFFCRTNRKLIVFESNLGRGYTGNPRAVYEEFVRRSLDRQYQLVWILMEKNEQAKIPGNFRSVRRESLPALWVLWKARVWVTDTRAPLYVKKNAKTFYMMTWHGTPLKKLGFDLETMVVPETGKQSREELERYWTELSQAVARWDCMLAQNTEAERLFRGCFQFNKEIMTVGYPRNDCLIKQNQPEYIAKLKTKLGLPPEKRIILYTPTWRDYEGVSECDYEFNPHLDFERVYKAIEKESIMIVKYHYYIKKRLDWSRYQGVIRDVEADISDLYLVSDLMITDYSSTMFDYGVLRRPMVFYPYDLERYEEERGFYYEYSEFVPGPVALTTNELLPMLSAGFDFSPYEGAMERFFDRYDTLESGNASFLVVDRILGNISGRLPAV